MSHMVGGDERPETRFASFGEDKIAYQVFGEGDVDLIYTPAAGDPIDLRWDWPSYAGFLRRLGRRARVVMFDPRGTGASDAPFGEALPTWERWAEDARSVMDALNVERAVLFGTNNGGPSAVLFAVTHPERTRGLVVGHSSARYVGPERSAAVFDATARFASESWGEPGSVELTCPDAGADPAFVRWATRSQRLAMSPRVAGAFFAAEALMDIRDALPLVRVPTLVLHREGFNSFVPVEQGRYIASHIDGARFVILPGRDAALVNQPYEECLEEIEAFLATLRPATDRADRSLATILFTDIVGSTARASEVGDREWHRLLETHDAVARTIVEQHRGRIVKTTGAGYHFEDRGDHELKGIDGTWRLYAVKP